MPEWRVNLSPKSENIITGDLSNSLSKWITITLQMAGRKWEGGGGIDVLCYRFLPGWFFILKGYRYARGPVASRLAATCPDEHHSIVAVLAYKTVSVF
ncbi:hypothetical protein EDJ60_17045 [Salmonella enterica]|nr:hypothetical protein [Salmonella enterica]